MKMQEYMEISKERDNLIEYHKNVIEKIKNKYGYNQEDEVLQEYVYDNEKLLKLEKDILNLNPLKNLMEGNYTFIPTYRVIVKRFADGYGHNFEIIIHEDKSITVEATKNIKLPKGYEIIGLNDYRIEVKYL